ncbi:hypothetical protein MMC17_001633 [Xylographa soralifera]|nr:hypothetical protein [Xylographa soralifera]
MSETASSFLDLPREVRDLCYEYLMTPNNREHPGQELLHQACGFAYAFPSAIFVLNRQIKQEASEVIYGRNTLSIELHPMYGDEAPRHLQARSNKIANAVEAFSRSSIRPFVKHFVLKIIVACYWYEFRNGMDLMVQSTGSRLPNRSTMSLLTDGPTLESLKIFLRLGNAGQANPPKETEDPRCKSDLPVYLQELTKRALNMKVHYDILSPSITRFFHEENFLQLERLGQQLHYRPAKNASLLGLPRECRDVIYKHLLSHEDQKEPVMIKWKPASTTFPTALLRSCSQIKEEAATFLYSHIQLSILIGLSSARMVMATVPPQYRALIRHYDIAIIQRYDSWPTYEKVHDVCWELRAGPRIKSVRIQIEVSKSPQFLRGSLDRHAFVDGFAPLADHVDNIIVGVIACRTPEWSRNEECYRRLRAVLDGPAKWSYPFRNYQFKD